MRQQYARNLEELERKEDYLLDLAADQGRSKEKLRVKIDGIRAERSEIESTSATCRTAARRWP
ncbi:hypothetical protein FHX81_3630 [Saccharothrix saharensis]|uniref:Uncharacterized protein n=1 Tax=Saccharothrix saharensis TaxID=571190 RepID=A0A543JEJ3_9PSEU|nr:hypothetical protein [Saccharothrix saharensis]TQM81267.1 hypothetical protein FHX81_3630 [Saccharothrix saharensis]